MRVILSRRPAILIASLVLSILVGNASASMGAVEIGCGIAIGGAWVAGTVGQAVRDVGSAGSACYNHWMAKRTVAARSNWVVPGEGADEDQIIAEVERLFNGSKNPFFYFCISSLSRVRGVIVFHKRDRRIS